MGIIELLVGFSSVLIVAGLIAGVFVGLGIAYLLHLFFPFHDLASLQAILIVVCSILGLVVGALVESRRKPK